MSNLIKSGFIAFANDNTLVIDANENKIIKGIESALQEMAISKETSMEESIAEAMLEDLEEDELPVVMDEEAEKEMAQELLQSAKKEAEEIVRQAHEEAERLRADAYEEAQIVKQQAKEEGYNEGYGAGNSTAQQEYEEKERLLEQRTAQKEQQLREEKETLQNEMEQQMVEWLCRLVPKVTGVAVEGQRDVLLYMVNLAIRDMDNSRKFVIRVSEADYEELAQKKDHIYGAKNPNVELQVFQDSKLAPLQCLIETEHGVVDASLDVQLENLNKALRLMMMERTRE